MTSLMATQPMYALGDGMALVGGAITNPATIAGLNFQPLPDVTAMLNMIQITGEYKFRPNITMIFGYACEKFDYANFRNTAGVTQYANAILPGTLSPNAAVQVVGAGCAYGSEGGRNAPRQGAGAGYAGLHSSVPARDGEIYARLAGGCRFASSAARHRYQAARERCGAQGRPNSASARGFGCASRPCRTR